MARGVTIGLILTVLLTVGVTTSAAAQDATLGPDRIEWHLVSYSSDGEAVPVSWLIDATLVLDDGQASGINGCNTFSGSYSLDGEALDFDDIVVASLVTCTDPAETVEQAYMSNLPSTASWSRSGDQLELLDADRSVVLAYEQATAGLTDSDLVALAAQLAAYEGQIDDLADRLGSVRGSLLQDRIRQLESEIALLRDQLRGADTSDATGSSGSFTAAEQILLEGIPGPIRRTCSPRRSGNPSDTLAAVQCKPDSPVVRDMAYYLMTAQAATAAFEQRMAENGVRSRARQCREGVASIEQDVPGPGVLGCYVNADGRAELHLIAPASGCNQLTVGSQTMPIPAIYVAVLGDSDALRRLARWRATSSLRPGLTQQIKRPDEPISPRCPS